MKKGLEIKCPTVPNFIKVGEQGISVAEFTEDELKGIGKMWTASLLENARKRKLSDKK